MTDNRIKGTQIGDSLIQSIDNLISTLQYLSNLDNQEPFYRNTKGCQSKLQLWIVTVTIQCVNHDFLRHLECGWWSDHNRKWSKDRFVVFMI